MVIDVKKIQYWYILRVDDDLFIIFRDNQNLGLLGFLEEKIDLVIINKRVLRNNVYKFLIL